jgi:hypothetical protein
MVTGGVQTAMPTARLTVESYTPWTMLSITVAHDLMIGPSAAGPLSGDVAAVAVVKDWQSFGAHLTAGIYHNSDVYRPFDVGALGYGLEGGVAFKFTRDLRLELAALRDARINDMTVGQQADRNVFQLRFVWEKTRFE